MVDSRIIQIMDFPALQIDVDRQRAARLGVAQRDVANNMLTSLAGSALVGPTYFLNPQTGVNYIVAVQTPADKIQSIADVLNLPANPAAPNINPELPLRRRLTTPLASPVTRISDIASVRAVVQHAVDQPLHRAARGGRRGQHRRPRSRQRCGRDQEDHRRRAEGPAVDGQDLPARPERGDGDLVPQSRLRADPGDHPGLCGAGRAVPVLGRSVHHHDGGAGRADRHSLDAGDDRHHHQRRLADGRDHVGRHRGVELDPGRELRQRPAQPQRKPDAVRGRRSRPARRGCGRSS